jgi:hypothetical protein
MTYVIFTLADSAVVKKFGSFKALAGCVEYFLIYILFLRLFYLTHKLYIDTML